MTAGSYVRFAGLTGATVNVFVAGPVVLAGLQFVAVPEAATLHLAALALAGLAVVARRRVADRTHRSQWSAAMRR